MDKLEKALKDLAQVVECNNNTISRITVTITFKKPKPDKANTEAE